MPLEHKPDCPHPERVETYTLTRPADARGPSDTAAYVHSWGGGFSAYCPSSACGGRAPFTIRATRAEAVQDARDHADAVHVVTVTRCAECGAATYDPPMAEQPDPPAPVSRDTAVLLPRY